MRSVTALFPLFVSLSASAQTIGTCDQSEATADLDVGNVRAGLFNGGNLFYSGGTGVYAAYEAPKDSGMSAAFAAQLWLGGMVQGELRSASATFVNQEFWPGPLDALGDPPGDCSVYDRIYSVYRTDVEHHLQSGEATDDLRDWPHDLGAPVLDGDGDPNNYSLEGGDQPAIWGDQTAWWVMNDLGNEHVRSQGDPLGIEVQVTAFAVDTPGQAYGDATYYIYRLLNKSTLPMDSMFATFWWDTDLGAAGDEYAGTDTTQMMAYAYNVVEDIVYGTQPPALGVKLLRGPLGDANGLDDDGDGDVDEAGERIGMTSTGMAINSASEPEMTDPFLSHHYYNLMNGLWRDGMPITEGGTGYQTGGPETKFVFPGDPVAGAYWSEVNVDGAGTEGLANNKRGMLSTGPFVIEPGGDQEIAFAIVFGHGSDNLDSITWMRIAADAIQHAFDEGGFDPQLISVRVEIPEGAGPIFLSRVVPNPFTDDASIRYSLPAALDVSLDMFDVLGRKVAVLVEGEQVRGGHEVRLDGNPLRPGVYLVRLQAGNVSRTIRFTRR